MNIQVHKFGGASVRDVEHIKNLPSIVKKFSGSKLFLVISAMGKTTNKLEFIVDKYIHEGDDVALSELNDLVEEHLKVAEDLKLNRTALGKQFNDLISFAWRKCEKAKHISKGALYDQIVSLGELLSTRLVNAYFESLKLKSTWCDIREIMKTDSSFRDGAIDFSLTQKLVQEKCEQLFASSDIIVSQGFIGSSPDGLTVTLGREGSDFTAAIIAYCLDVEDVCIWKDVPGVLTADPRKFDNVEKIDRMSYNEAIEMTYYGAQVIHPKTIRPLQNKGIKLHVKSFIDPNAEGTTISSDGLLNYPPIVVIQEDVILLQISSKDFSFIAENHLSKIFEMMNRNRIKLCTMRNSAISFSMCIKNPGQEEFVRLVKELESEFSVDVFKNLQLYTIRYFNTDLIRKLTKNKVILFEEKMKYTVQIVVRPALELKEKNQ